MIFDEAFFTYGDGVLLSNGTTDYKFKSYTYGLAFAHIDTSQFNDMAGAINLNTIYDNKNRRNYLVSNDYKDSALKFDVEIIKVDTCNGRNKTPFLSTSECREIESKLFNRRTYKKLRLVNEIGEILTSEAVDEFLGGGSSQPSGTTKYGWNDPNDKRIILFVRSVVKESYLNVVFTNPVRITDSAGHTIGYKCTVNCGSNMLLQESISQLANTFDTSQYYPVYVYNDEDEYIYPKVTVTVGSQGGNIGIINTSDDRNRKTEFLNVPAGKSFIIDGSHNIVTGDMYNNFSGYNFPRLISGIDPSPNIIYVTGNISTLKFEWNNKRFLI